MKSLNSKGITTIEVLVCFVLVVMITVSMYSTISSYNEKRIIEEYKEKVIDYKNILTKEIQDDFIKIGIKQAKYDRTTSGDKVIYTVNCIMRDNTTRILKITQALALSDYHITGSPTTNDEFLIEYGTDTDMVEYPIPDLGSYKNSEGKIVKDLSLNNIIIDITDENVLSIYIGFYHPDLLTRYAISIVSPIDYISTGNDGTHEWEYGY